MPQIGKRALTQFIRTGCMRQLALNLYPDNADFREEREKLKMPYPQVPRPGLRPIQEEGEKWQAEKLDDLAKTFGEGSVIGDGHTTEANQIQFEAIALEQYLRGASVSFLVEAEFSVKAGGAFETALDISSHRTEWAVEYTKLRPDIIQVLEPSTFDLGVRPDGDTKSLQDGDTRQQLRIIDIKMTAHPSPGYFAEVALYSMVLAGWLVDEGLDQDFVVVPEAALWAGSHQASKLLKVYQEAQKEGREATTGELRDAMGKDLEPVPFEVCVLRVRRFLQHDVPAALEKRWDEHEWHVDNRCAFCEYLGEPRPANPRDPKATPHRDHCLPTAQKNDHLSRVAFISQGARLSLTERGVGQVSDLADMEPENWIFDAHQALRATRTVVASRATALSNNTTRLADSSGTSASMPKWADLRIYLSVDFDIGSAITVAFGLSAFWYEPRPRWSLLDRERESQAWPRQAQIVEDKDLSTERRELLAFLRKIHDILIWCQQRDKQTLQQSERTGVTPTQKNYYRTKVQLYLWDSLQMDHLTRMIGRHLDAILANREIDYLAWLFPPEELLENPELVTRKSPITIVRDVVRGHLAVPVAHYYSLLEVARKYHDTNLPEKMADFSIHPLFGTPLSDQIPSERAHEIWARVTAPVHWQQQMKVFSETVQKRLAALETVTKRLEVDLRATLRHSAPIIGIEPPARQTKVSSDGQLWHAFSKLDAALNELEIHRVRAMPPHERAARFRSARLGRRLHQQEEQEVLRAMDVQADRGTRVYELKEDSRDLKAKIGDFDVAVAPENDAGLLDRKLCGVVRDTALNRATQEHFRGRYWQVLMEEVLRVTIVGLDRNEGFIAVEADRRYPTILDDLEREAGISLDRDVILDPIHQDFFTGKLLKALQAIGNPQIAKEKAAALAQTATGQRGRGAHRTPHTPVADCLWGAETLANTSVERNLDPVKEELQSHGLTLNASQWQAWKDALTHRARLIWGPPGTGKSRTVRAVVVGASLEAGQNNRPCRVLVCASTYTAIDNVLTGIAEDVGAVLPDQCDVLRLRSTVSEAPPKMEGVTDLALNRREPSQAVIDLLTTLQNGESRVVVGSTPDQAHNLLICQDGSAQAEWFDLIVVDEASQMDVGHAVLPLCGLAKNGSVILAGDPLQLSPIHRASPPKDLEDLVGSVYTFWKSVRGVQETALETNYRSNETIVSFAQNAGYRSTLKSHSPDLSIKLTSPLPQTAPAEWPQRLEWSPEWANLLDPAQRAVCFVYEDGKNSQRNEFEADGVAAMLWLLSGRVAEEPQNEIDTETGEPRPTNTTPYSTPHFWKKAVGVVTPHRAQQGLIVTRLLEVFNATGEDAEMIRNAVDTVERFQGQQRDIIIASYTLGDPDQIAEEDEFLMSLNRFNVIASRARAKLVVLVSQEILNHLAHDIEVLRESKLLKVYAESFCGNRREMILAHRAGGTVRRVKGSFRWRA